MKRSMHSGILVLILTIVMLFGLAVNGAAAQEIPAAAAQVAGTVEATAEPDTSGVTDLPDTGRGYGVEAEGTRNLAMHQMVTTVLVLLLAAVMALGGLALLWRYERR